MLYVTLKISWQLGLIAVVIAPILFLGGKHYRRGMRQGWRTAYQGTARAWTVFPNTFRGFVKQRIRWSRNSYRCYFRAMARGWLWQRSVVITCPDVNQLGEYLVATRPHTLFGPPRVWEKLRAGIQAAALDDRVIAGEARPHVRNPKHPRAFEVRKVEENRPALVAHRYASAPRPPRSRLALA